MSISCDKTFLLVTSSRSSVKVMYGGHGLKKKWQMGAIVPHKHILLKIDDSHCDRINSSLKVTVVLTTVMWKIRQLLKMNNVLVTLVRCTGLCNKIHVLLNTKEPIHQ